MQLLLIKNSSLERGNTIHDPITVEQYYCTLALICKNHLFHSYSSQCCCLIHLEILPQLPRRNFSNEGGYTNIHAAYTNTNICTCLVKLNTSDVKYTHLNENRTNLIEKLYKTNNQTNLFN